MSCPAWPGPPRPGGRSSSPHRERLDQRVLRLLRWPLSGLLLSGAAMALSLEEIAAQPVERRAPIDEARDAVGLGAAGAPAARAARERGASGRPPGSSLSGQVSLRSYLSTDDGSAPTPPYFSISFLETDLRGERLSSAGLALQLDATFLLDLHDAQERRFGETERFDQIRQLYLEQPLGAFKLRAGRRLIAEAGNGWIDGGELSLGLLQDRVQLGAYGGLAPDPFDRSFGTERQGFGLYSVYDRRGLNLTGAWHGELFAGQLDRHYVHQRSHWVAGGGLALSNYLILDLLDAPRPSTLLTTIDYQASAAVNLSLNLSRYSLARYRQQQVYRNIIEPNQLLLLGDEVIDLVYHRARFTASLRFTRSLYHYQSLEFKRRAQDAAEAWIYSAGFREEDLLRSDIELDLRGQVAAQFRASDWLLSLTGRRAFGARFAGELRLSWLSGRTVDQRSERLRLFDEAHELFLMGLSVTLRPSRAHQLALAYDGVLERGLVDARSDESLLIHTGMFRYRWLY